MELKNKLRQMVTSIDDVYSDNYRSPDKAVDQIQALVDTQVAEARIDNTKQLLEGLREVGIGGNPIQNMRDINGWIIDKLEEVSPFNHVARTDGSIDLELKPSNNDKESQ